MIMDKYLDMYAEKFNEQFPMMLCRHMTESEIIETIEKCIKEGTPYEPELDEKSNY